MTTYYIEEAEQVLDAQTRDQLWQWLKQGMGSRVLDQIKALVNHAHKPSNALSMISHLRAAKEQFQRLASTLNHVEDPELQAELEPIVNRITQAINSGLSACFEAASQGNPIEFTQAQAAYQQKAEPAIHDLVHVLRAVFANR